MSRPFLTAEWRNLVMLNYAVDPAVLRSLVPKGTELDSWHGTHFVSVVGFQYFRTRVLGLPVPFHRHFEEVNLRFYVRRKAAEGWRRGVVFIKEVVPREAVAFVARWFYNENFVAHPMTSQVRLPGPSCYETGSAAYTWSSPTGTHRVRAEFQGTPSPAAGGSAEEFITEQ